jgi:hypothetical protein
MAIGRHPCAYPAWITGPWSGRQAARWSRRRLRARTAAPAWRGTEAASTAGGSQELLSTRMGTWLARGGRSPAPSRSAGAAARTGAAPVVQQPPPPFLAHVMAEAAGLGAGQCGSAQRAPHEHRTRQQGEVRQAPGAPARGRVRHEGAQRTVDVHRERDPRGAWLGGTADATGRVPLSGSQLPGYPQGRHQAELGLPR